MPVPEEPTALAEVVVSRGPDRTLVEIVGELDMSNADDVQKQLGKAVEGSDVLVVDLSRLGFIDSAGIAVLDRLHRWLNSSGPTLMIVAAPRSVAGRTLRMAGMDRVLPVTPSRDEPAVSRDRLPPGRGELTPALGESTLSPPLPSLEDS